MLKEVSSLIFCVVMVIGCASRVQPAPIENMTTIPNYIQPNTTVAAHSTASVEPAAVTSTPPAQMGALNDNRKAVVPTATVQPVPVKATKPLNSPVPIQNSATLSAGSGSEWIIPTTGKTEGYINSAKGMDIYGTEGQKIVAINDGKVVYSGNGLKGYGNLIIIKHSDSYLSAYAHNKANLVKEGAIVKRGQQIATMGTGDNGKAVLHLEVRKNGKPIDPFTVIKHN